MKLTSYLLTLPARMAVAALRVPYDDFLAWIDFDGIQEDIETLAVRFWPADLFDVFEGEVA